MISNRIKDAKPAHMAYSGDFNHLRVPVQVNHTVRQPQRGHSVSNVQVAHPNVHFNYNMREPRPAPRPISTEHHKHTNPA